MKTKSAKGGTISVSKPVPVQFDPAPSYASDPSTPSDPTLVGRAEELVGYLESAFFETGKMRSSMFGEGESGGVTRVPPTTLTGLLARACEQAASLVGELRTINSRLDK